MNAAAKDKRPNPTSPEFHPAAVCIRADPRLLPQERAELEKRAEKLGGLLERKEPHAGNGWYRVHEIGVRLPRNTQKAPRRAVFIPLPAIVQAKRTKLSRHAGGHALRNGSFGGGQRNKLTTTERVSSVVRKAFIQLGNLAGFAKNLILRMGGKQ